MKPASPLSADEQLLAAAADQFDREAHARQLLARASGLSLIALSSSLEEDGTIDPGVDPLGIVLLAFAARGRRLIRSAIRLLDAGEQPEAVPLLRIAAEYLIVAMWLRHDPTRLAGWAVADHEKRARVVRKVRDALADQPDLQAALDAQLQELDAERAAWTEPLADAPADTTNIETMAEDVGVAFAYQLAYRIQSQSDVHATALAVDTCYDHDESGVLRLRSTPQPGLAQYDQYALAAHLLLDLLTVTANHQSLRALMWRTGLAGIRDALVATRASDPRRNADPARVVLEVALAPMQDDEGSPEAS